MQDEIIRCLISKYHPRAVLVYGSFADGAANEKSDFDALLVCDAPPCRHDGGRVDGVLLDVFLYVVSEIEAALAGDVSPFVQLYNARIALDDNGLADRLRARVRAYLDENAKTSPEDKQHLLEWCDKMLARAQRGDAEGLHRWHWLLTDSPEVYCQLRDLPYFGPKKTLRALQKDAPEAYALYARALGSMDYAALSRWIAYMINVPAR